MVVRKLESLNVSIQRMNVFLLLEPGGVGKVEVERERFNINSGFAL